MVPTCPHHFLTAAAVGSAPGEKWAKPSWGLVAVSKTLTGVGYLKRICEYGFGVAGTGRKTSP
jgi:hypothetical protein